MASRLPPSSSRRAGDGWKINKQQTNNKQINKQTNYNPCAFNLSQCLPLPLQFYYTLHTACLILHLIIITTTIIPMIIILLIRQNSLPPIFIRILLIIILIILLIISIFLLMIAIPPDLTSIYLLICHLDHHDPHPGETLCPRSYFPPTGLHLRVSPPLTHSVSLPECS